MTDKQIDKWLRRQFSVIGWVLMGYYALINGLSAIAMAKEALVQMLGLIGHKQTWWTELDMNAMLSNAWGYIMAIAVMFVILHAWKGSRYWWEEVFFRERKVKPGVLLALLCMCMGCQMVNSFWVVGLETLFNQSGKSLMPLLETVSGSADSVSMFLYMSLLAPIAEELLFRGFVLRTLKPFGKKFAVFGSALLFGLFHGNLLQTPYAFLVGLLLGYVTVEYSIAWAIGVHMFNNLILADLMSRLTASLPVAVADGIQMILFGGCLAVSAIILVVKRKNVGDYLAAERMDRRVLKCFFLNFGMVLLMILMLANIAMMLP